VGLPACVLPGPCMCRRVCLRRFVRSSPLTAPFFDLTSVCLRAPHSARCSARGGARGRGVSCPSLGPRNHACAPVRVGLAFPEGCRALDDPFPEVSSGLSPVRPSARPGTRGGVLRPVRRASRPGVGTGARAFRCVVPRAPCLASAYRHSWRHASRTRPPLLLGTVRRCAPSSTLAAWRSR
jgi:hypothetical protein